MLIEAARRAEAAVREMLAIANDGSATTDEYRDALGVSKLIAGINSAFQTSAAANVAGRERHGDGGAEVLADAAGLSRREAHGHIKAARVIEAVPAVRDAVESGRVTVANSRRLAEAVERTSAEAVERTSAEAVEGDRELLAKAESMRPEQFARETRRWVVDRDQDGGASMHARQRARRCVRVWDGDDGMVHLRGEFDVVTGRRIGNRLREMAGRLYDADKKNATDSDEDRRTFKQCMADALDDLTAGAGAGSGSGKPFADICVVAHVDDKTGKLIAELPDDVRLPPSILEECACNARLTGVVYDRDGKPIWRANSVRTATKAQRQILMSRYGGCCHCAAHPALCQIHHIKPASEGGSTRLDNMVPVCWDCHNKIHHHDWYIHKSPDGNHTLHPPGQLHYGPARTPEAPSPLFNPDTAHAPTPQPQGRSHTSRAPARPPARVTLDAADP